MKRGKNSVMAMLGLITQLGIMMIVPIMLCTLFGAWLGHRTGMPVIAVLFFVIGAVAGFNGVYKIVRHYLSNEKRPGQIAREMEEKAALDEYIKKDQ